MKQYLCEKGHVTEELYLTSETFRNPRKLCSICALQRLDIQIRPASINSKGEMSIEAVNPLGDVYEGLREPSELPKGYKLVKEPTVIPLTPEQVLAASSVCYSYIAKWPDSGWWISIDKPELHRGGWELPEDDERWQVDPSINIKSYKPWRESLVYRGDL